jgi:hypothetical protein
MDPLQKIPKEALLRYMCDLSEWALFSKFWLKFRDVEINRINEVLLLREKSDQSGEKEINYAMFIQVSF